MPVLWAVDGKYRSDGRNRRELPGITGTLHRAFSLLVEKITASFALGLLEQAEIEQTPTGEQLVVLMSPTARTRVLLCIHSLCKRRFVDRYEKRCGKLSLHGWDGDQTIRFLRDTRNYQCSLQLSLKANRWRCGYIP
ncbi:hypothetical protein CLAIMM_08219 isoform 2, partial [Cladophialophora immunda]